MLIHLSHNEKVATADIAGLGVPARTVLMVVGIDLTIRDVLSVFLGFYNCILPQAVGEAFVNYVTYNLVFLVELTLADFQDVWLGVGIAYFLEDVA